MSYYFYIRPFTLFGLYRPSTLSADSLSIPISLYRPSINLIVLFHYFSRMSLADYYLIRLSADRPIANIIPNKTKAFN